MEQTISSRSMVMVHGLMVADPAAQIKRAWRCPAEIKKFVVLKPVIADA